MYKQRFSYRFLSLIITGVVVLSAVAVPVAAKTVDYGSTIRASNIVPCGYFPTKNVYFETIFVGATGRETIGDEFLVPSGYNRITSSTKADNDYGTTTLTVKLQKKGLWWSTVATVTIPTDGSVHTLVSGIKTSAGNRYRLAYSTNGLGATAIVSCVFGNW